MRIPSLHAAYAAARRQLPKSLSYRRLDSSLRAFQAELPKVVEEAHARGEPVWAWAGPAGDLLADVERALRFEISLEAGWACFEAATRMALWGLPDAALDDRAAALRTEAGEKLSTWRRATVERLLADDLFGAASAGSHGGVTSRLRPERSPEDRKRQRLVLATQLRDEQSQNQYRKLAALQRQLVILGVAVMLATGGILVVLARGERFPLARVPPGDGNAWAILVPVVLFGVVGGALSGMRALSGGSTGVRIPAQLENGLVTLARPVIGAAAALAAYAFLRADILPLKNPAGGVIATVAFAAGFSEQLVLRAVESVVGDPNRGRDRGA